MSTTEIRGNDATRDASVANGGMRLEVVVIPVSDVDRAKDFYAGLGWRLDADFRKDDGRVVQFTPPGSQCSVHFGMNMTSAAPGSARNFLIVSDIQAARDELVGRGVEVSGVFHYAGFNRVDLAARLSGPAPDRRSYGSFVSFSDPDGNSWFVQEVTTRLPGRIDRAATAFRFGERSGGRASARGGCPRRAREAHRSRDENWPDWYAAYMVAEQTGGVLPS